jgi:anti-anti-sigma factor
MQLSLNPRYCGDVYVIHCQGHIVVGEEEKSLEAALDLGAREVSRLVLCVSELDRMDSTGIGLLVRYASKLRKRGGDLRLAAPPQFLLELLKLTMLSAVLQVHATEEDAILSFLKQAPAEKGHGKAGPRVLVLDQSADLCMFVKTVLMQQGYDVRSASYVHDARILLQVDKVDYILVGPDSPQLCNETVMKSLKALAPKAASLQLDPDFKSRDALDAGQSLLQLFRAQPS